MDIKELFSKPYCLLRHNILLFQPLWCFAVLLVLVMPEGAKTASKPFIFLLMAVGGLFCAFLAGWFNMFSKIVASSDKLPETPEEKANYLAVSLKEFFPGVGQYFLKVLLGVILYLILLFIMLNIAGIVGAKCFGYPHSFTQAEFLKASINQQSALKFVHKISTQDIILIYKWFFLTFGSILFLAYITMFWLQSVIAGDKNPVFAYIESIKIILKDPIMTFIMFIFYSAALIISAVLYMIGTFNFVIQTIGLIIFTFVVIYFTMMMFVYFEKYRKNNSNPRTNSFG